MVTASAFSQDMLLLEGSFAFDGAESPLTALSSYPGPPLYAHFKKYWGAGFNGRNSSAGREDYGVGDHHLIATLMKGNDVRRGGNFLLYFSWSICVLLVGVYAPASGATSLPALCIAGTGCLPHPLPSPIRTPTATPTPVQTGPRPLGDGSGGYDYHVEYQWNPYYLDAYAEVTPAYLTANKGDSESFETDELWRMDGDSSGSWQEIGFTTGYLNGQFYSGTLFGAYNSSSGYYEFPIGSPNPPSNDPDTYENEIAVSLAVEPSDEYIVDFNYNGQTWASSTGMWDYSDSMQIGVESDNSTPSFNSFSA